MKEAVIVAYGRSAVCKSRKGGFSGTHPVDYAAQVLKGVLDQVPEIDRKEIEDIIVGCAVQHNKTSMNVAKNIAARAELPSSVSAQSMNRFCSSGLQAVVTAANAIAAGQGDIYVAGGVEDMTGTFEPYPEKFCDSWLLENAQGAYMPMGITAENVAKKFEISRESMDRFAVESHQKAKRAKENGKLTPSIIPVKGVDFEGNEKIIAMDEGIREDISFESLQTLKPCFVPENGTVTAATSSQTSDAAAFVVLMSLEKAQALGIKPIAKLINFAVAGCDSTIMGVGPVYAVPKVMKRAGLEITDMDVIEINEAFASQALYCIDVLGFDKEKVNPYGGAIALGHPLGATGAILICKALDYLKDNNGEYGLVTMCIGGGMGAAGILQRID